MSANYIPYDIYTWTTKDVADQYEYTEGYVRSLAQQGEIPSIRVGRGKIKKDYRFNPREVAVALAGRAVQIGIYSGDTQKVADDDDLDYSGV